jgi:arabinogalactan oligomer/maltooligosaccharide transport system permease protein
MRIDAKYYSMNPIQKIGYKVAIFFKNFKSNMSSFSSSFSMGVASKFRKAIDGLKVFGSALVKGDIFTKLSFLVLGLGAFKRKQYFKAIFYTLIEFLFIYALIVFMIPNISKLSLQNLVQAEEIYNPDTMQNERNDYDNTFLILLYSIISFVLIIAFLIFYINVIMDTYNSQLIYDNGGHLNGFKEDLSVFLNKKFHFTLLLLPVLGVLFFTIIPLIFMICTAFTNYDVNHLPPTYLFSWVGFKNFATLFGGQVTSNFSYAFGMTLWWTIVRAFFATFTNYFGGIFLALLINNKRTKFKKMRRTIFVVTIAIPQFVSLMLIKYFMYDTGILNYFCTSIGLTGWLQSIGWIKTSYIPFFSDPTRIKWTVIFVNMWVGFPYLMLIATGILMNIPADLYESAKVDGASKIKMFNKITMPYMFFVTGPYLINSFTNNLNNFNVIYLLTSDYTTTSSKLSSVNATEADILISRLFKLTQDKNDYKMASVIGIAIFVISAFFTLIAFAMINGRNREEKFQ